MRRLYYFKINYGNRYALIPSLEATSANYSLWRFSKTPPGIRSSWEDLAIDWIEGLLPRFAQKIADIPDGYFLSWGRPPSRRVFHKVRARRRLELSNRTMAVPQMESYLEEVMNGFATNVKCMEFDLPDPASFSRRSKAAVRYIDWQVLPPGWWRDPLLWVEARTRFGPWLASLDFTRMEYIDSLGPREWALGRALGGRAYHVAIFNNLALAECPLEGNALYWCPAKDWELILGLNKWQALRAGARRILHKSRWRQNVRRLLRIHGEPIVSAINLSAAS